MAHTYPNNDGPFKNPHKGWNSGWGNVYDEASVGFQYLAWKDLEPGNGQFDFAAVEGLLSQGGTKGKHFILRLYCEYSPGDDSRCPDWLYTQKGVKRILGDNGTYLTDFNDPNFISEAVLAIKALAAHYDNDPRVHAFELGVLGYWGEWHTWSFSAAGKWSGISGTTYDAILNAYTGSFKAAMFQRRYPSSSIPVLEHMGYHNDWFVANDGSSDSFDQALSGGQWLGGPVGGEVPPMNAATATAGKQAMYTTSKGPSMIAAGHYSTMQPGTYQVSPGDPYYGNYLKLHKMMGYNYQIASVNFADSLTTKDAMPVQLMAKNIGVAPLYYDWQVQFALLDSQDKPVVQSPANFQLKSVKPGESFTLSSNLDPVSLSPGNYRLAVRLIEPGADTAKPAVWKLDARNTYILFSNDLSVVDGSWGADNGLKGGWSVLGTIVLR